MLEKRLRLVENNCYVVKKVLVRGHILGIFLTCEEAKKFKEECDELAYIQVYPLGE